MIFNNARTMIFNDNAWGSCKVGFLLAAFKAGHGSTPVSARDIGLEKLCRLICQSCRLIPYTSAAVPLNSLSFSSSVHWRVMILKAFQMAP